MARLTLHLIWLQNCPGSQFEMWMIGVLINSEQWCLPIPSFVIWPIKAEHRYSVQALAFQISGALQRSSWAQQWHLESTEHTRAAWYDNSVKMSAYSKNTDDKYTSRIETATIWALCFIKIEFRIRANKWGIFMSKIFSSTLLPVCFMYT